MLFVHYQITRELKNGNLYFEILTPIKLYDGESIERKLNPSLSFFPIGTIKYELIEYIKDIPYIELTDSMFLMFLKHAKFWSNSLQDSLLNDKSEFFINDFKDYEKFIKPHHPIDSTYMEFGKTLYDVKFYSIHEKETARSEDLKELFNFIKEITDNN